MCYQCSKCNQCGRFSYRAVVLCKSCGSEIPPGAGTCPLCEAGTEGNLRPGKMAFDPHAPVRGKRAEGPLPTW